MSIYINNDDMNFFKTFLAGVLAFIAGTFLVGIFWMVLLLGSIGLLSKQAAPVEEE